MLGERSSIEKNWGPYIHGVFLLFPLFLYVNILVLLINLDVILEELLVVFVSPWGPKEKETHPLSG